MIWQQLLFYIIFYPKILLLFQVVKLKIFIDMFLLLIIVDLGLHLNLQREDPEYDFLEFAWGFGTDGFDSSGAEIEETDWIGISKSEKDYKIENIDRIIFNCKSIPEEVLSSTLSSDALGLIGVNRDNLKIQNVTKNYKDYMNVYSMSETQAIKKL